MKLSPAGLGTLAARLSAKRTVRRAERAIRAGRLQEAASTLQTLVSKDPNLAPVSAYLLLSRAYAMQGRFDEYDAFLKARVEQLPNSKLRAIVDATEDTKKIGWHARSVLRLVQYTPQIGDRGSADKIPVGYQATTIGGICVPGLREPEDRLNRIPIDFTGKTVLDIGCNLGGFLFPIADRIRWGVGLDYDSRLINACHKLRALRPASTLNFFVYDLEREPAALIPQFLPEPRVDVVLLLRILSDRLSPLLHYLATVAETIVFEPIKRHSGSASDIDTLFSLFQAVERIDTDIFEPIDASVHTLYVASKPIVAI